MEQIDQDLPGTIQDEEEFTKLLENFNFNQDCYTKISLEDPTCTQISDEINRIYDIVLANTRN